MVWLGCADYWMDKGGFIMSNEEIILENTEIVEEEIAETFQEVNMGYTQSMEILTQIYNDVHLIMVLTILTFVSACLRGWRKNVIKGVR